MGVLTGLRMGVVIFLLASLAAGGLWLRYQLHVQRELTLLNQHLTEQNNVMTDRMTQLITQVATMSAVLREQNHQQQRLEENSDAVRKQLRTVLAKDTCAHQPVPDDVIQLQRDSLASHFALSQ